MTVKVNHMARLTQLRKRLSDEDLDCFLVADGHRLRYLIGYSGSNGLLAVGGGLAEFFTDGRYRQQARQEVRGARVNIVGSDLLGQLPKIRALARGRPRIGYDRALLSDALAQRLRALLPRAFFAGIDDPVGPLMQRKDSGEIACIKQATAIADRAFAAILPAIRPGVRERDVAAELEYVMNKDGSEGVPFDTIVASGPRSALPHGRASTKRIRKGDFVTLDYGARVDGYVSDITRTVVVGRASARQRRVYDLVGRAQKAAIDRAHAGVACAALDRAARRVIARGGMAKRFDHGLGHGIGLAVHEGPAVNARSSVTLAPGMVITVEPGVYIPGWGGVRIEDDVLIGRNGATVLTQAERGLIEL